MKGFYLISAAVVAMLMLSPYVLLKAPKPDRFKNKTVLFGSYGAAVKSLDPATCGDTTSSGFQGNVYEGLYTYHFLKRPIEVIASLAEGMPKVSDDGMTYRIKLKAGIKYQRNACFGFDASGKPKTRTVKARDFVLAFKRIADYHVNTGLAWAFVGRIKGIKEFRKRTRRYKIGDFSRYDDLDIEGVKAIDDLTLEFKLSEPFPQFIYVLAMHVYAPIPREAVDYWLATEADGHGGRRSVPVQKRDVEFHEPEQVVGTGPYLFDTFERKYKIVLVRNPDFRDDFYPAQGADGDSQAHLLDDAGKKTPFIDVLHYDFIPENYSGWMLFQNRLLDASGIPKEAFDSVINPDRKLEDKWEKKHIHLRTYSSPSVYWIVFNMEDKVVSSSKSLRQALCLAFDVESYVKVLFNGRGKRAVNILPRSFKGWKEAGVGPYYKLDLDLAKKKIAQAKKELSAKGLLVDGEIPELTLDLGGTGRSSARQGEFIRQQFAKIGVRLKIELNDWPTLQGKVANKRCQMYTMGWTADYPDAENFLQLYYSPNIAKQTNNSNYSNPKFDKLYEKVRLMRDTPQRTALYAQMVRMVSEDCPVLLLTEPVSYVLFYDWVKNVKPHPIGYGYSKYRRIDTTLRRQLDGRQR